MRLEKMGPLLSGLALFLASTSDVRADLSIKIYENGTAGTPVIFTTTGTTLTLTGTPASGSFAMATPDYSFTGVTATATIGTQGGITLTGTIGSTMSALHTLTILVSENSYTGGGPNYTMTSSGGYSFNTGGTAGIADTNSAFTFQAFATPGSNLFGMTVPGPAHPFGGAANSGLSYGLPTGSSNTFNETGTAFTAAAGYTLTQSYVYTSNASGETLGVNGSTIAPTAVPEPASIFLFAIGAGSAGLVAARRRARRRSGCLDSRIG